MRKIFKSIVSTVTILMMAFSPFVALTPLAQAATPVEIFYESFGITPSASVPGWVTHENSFVDDSGGMSEKGAYAVMSADGSGNDGWICKSVDATNFKNLVLKYYYKGNDSSHNNYGDIEFNKSGNCTSTSGWNNIESINLKGKTTWSSQQSETLPNSGSNDLDNTTFKIRFRADVDYSTRLFSVDEISIEGEPLTPASININTINGNQPPFNFVCPENPLFNPVTIAGSGSGNTPPGDVSQYHVKIDWGDEQITDALGTFTPSSGNHTAFTFTFNGTHNYTTLGNFTITALLYHQKAPGQDNQQAQSIPIEVCVHVPAPTDGSITVNKIVINDDGKTATTSDFHLFVNDNEVTNGIVADFAAGVSYTITESGPTTNYTPGFSGDCDVQGVISNIVAGQHLYLHYNK